MAYMLGQLAGALVISGIIISLALLLWKRPIVVSAVVGVVLTLLYAWRKGEFTPWLVVACAMWALLLRQRLKLRAATSPKAKEP